MTLEETLLAPDMIARYPRSSKYDPHWIHANQLGSHCLWLLEALCQEMKLEPGMRVLDLGCGKAIGSIFLAREFGVQVWATDLKVDVTGNWKRITEAGMAAQICPIHADGCDLPYAQGYFDALVSINALQFFAASDERLRCLARLVRPGGQIGMVVPGLFQEFDGPVPDYLQPMWSPDFATWHSPGWWQDLWQQTGLVEVKTADTFADREGYHIFRKWEDLMGTSRLVEVDDGRNISFVRLVATRRE